MKGSVKPVSSDGTQLVHVGRQPIFDVHGDVVAYELLFRGSMDSVAAGRQDTFATSTVMVNAFTEFGINEVAGDRLCFINLTREFLAGQLPLPLGPEQVVLEVLDGDRSRLHHTAAACRTFPKIKIGGERLETDEQLALADKYQLELRQG